MNSRSAFFESQNWSRIKGLGLLILLIGDLAIMIAQANLEIRMLTQLDEDSAFWISAAVFCVGTVVFGLLSWSFANWMLVWLDETFPNGEKLFKQLADLHGLSSQERAALLAASKLLALPQSSILFLDESLWDRARSVDPASMDPLRHKLFGSCP